MLTAARIEALFRKKLGIEKETRTYTVTSNKECLDKLEKIMLAMHLLGSMGASREITFGWDGDGADYLDVKELKKKRLDRLDTDKSTIHADSLKIEEG
jgi:hypothetical protein